MKTSEQINELAAALSKAQGEMGAAIKDAKNPFFKADYSTLASVIDASKDALTKNGLAVVQAPQHDERGIVLETTIMHTSGQWITSTYPINPVKNDPQGLGSCISYAKRYSLQAMLCIPSADDDGQAATIKPVSAPTPFKRMTEF